MAEWDAPLPPNNVEAGAPGHPGMHNELVDAITEIRAEVDRVETIADDAAETAVWGEIEGIPTALTTAGAAGTATIRALGTGATQAAAGDHTHAAPAASTVTTTAIDGVTGTNVQAVLAELAARLDELEDV